MPRQFVLTLSLIGMVCWQGCSPANTEPTPSDSNATSAAQGPPADAVETKLVADVSPSSNDAAEKDADMPELETVTLGAGCFWCIEAVLLRVNGVESVVSGYMGGSVPNPSYQMVCTGRTGHAEVVQIKFDPEVISLDKLLDVFWQIHDPTTLNRQGYDIGTQYRSAIFYHDDQQKEIAEASKEKWGKSRKFKDPIVTEITKATEFYPAEDYHQDYFAKNPSNPYCRANIIPKLKKMGLLKRSDR